MIDINWHIFKAKFHERQNSAFEALAYMLFSYEHNIKIGIFRFKNQAGIETEPIDIDGIVTGFQAKYYDTKLSDNQKDIIDSLKRAKEKNPALSKVFLYTNQELSESPQKKQKKPSYQIAIEKAGQDLGVKVEWRVPSHIERQLSLPENDYLATYFFSADPGIVDFLDGLKLHSRNVLFAIQTDIDFNSQKIKINREKILPLLTDTTRNVIILSGDGGSGKTAVIKDAYNLSKTPFYIFKAAEFNKNSVSALLNEFGPFGLKDFLQAHENEATKTFVIDSAEKLAELNNQDVFIEFLSALIQDKWKIIFTTRNSYLDDLSFQLLEIYRLHFETIQLRNLSQAELENIANEFKFLLPSDARLKSLVSNLFYLNEYLSNYDVINAMTDLTRFRDILWQKKILNSKFKKDNIHLEREHCFLGLAKCRSVTGNFYLKAEQGKPEIMSLLTIDGIIEFEPAYGAYFITHDIYEEWALDKIIEKAYISKSSYGEFFEAIGNSLSIRRAFRAWLSDKLARSIPDIKQFIESVFQDSSIPAFWKDELLISVMLSSYSSEFFKIFYNPLLDNNKHDLKKILFLLRTACKAADDTMQAFIGKLEDFSTGLQYFFTKPKGKGWESTIQFLHDRITVFEKNDLPFILPVIKDWITHNATGETTRNAGLFALYFYKDAELNTKSYYKSEVEKDLLDIVLASAKELKTELTAICNSLLESDDENRAYESLQEKVLSSNNDSLQFIIALPEFVVKLADRFWYAPKTKRHPYYSGGIGVEQYYSIKDHHEYYPASALQTPIYYLLQIDFAKTIKFILSFTNRAVREYFLSGFDNSVREIDVSIGPDTSKQIISVGLWCMYRGTGSPVTPYLLQSMHMSLEKYFLEITKISDKKIVKNWLIYLLKNTQSTSITAVVTSIVLAYPDEFFEVAIILFGNYEFFRCDSGRAVSEMQAESLYSIGGGLNYKTKVFDKERLATCKQPHRKLSLENLALNYQYFKSKDVSDEEVAKRQTEIWQVIDRYHKELLTEDVDIEQNKRVRLLLARIDRRKMNPTVKEDGDKLIIEFNPELDPDLKEYSSQGMEKLQKERKYTSLKLWGTNKWEGFDRYGSYPQYDENPALVLKETKEIIEGLKESDHLFSLYNDSTPGYTCAALIKLYSDKLTDEDLNFCKEVIIDYASAPLKENYSYQISDGVEAAVNALPFLYNRLPDDVDQYNLVFLLLLFDTTSIGSYKRICDYSIEAFPELFKVSMESANTIFLQYLSLKGKFDEQSHPRNRIADRKSRVAVLQEFLTKHETDFVRIEDLQVFYNKIEIKSLDLKVVETAFQLIPDDTTNPIHLDFAKNAIFGLSALLLSDEDIKDSFGQNDYHIRHRIFRKIAGFLLNRGASSLEDWTLPLANSFTTTRETADFISDLVSTEDKLKKYETFWFIWESFYPAIKQIATEGGGHHLHEIITNYLLAWPWWKETAKEWHTLQVREKLFFKKVCKEIGFHASVLYSIAKLLNQIGSSFIEDGIVWISDMLSDNANLYTQQLPNSTIFYLEILVRRYVYLNRSKLKADILMKGKLMVILNFLIANGSVNGYLLREDII